MIFLPKELCIKLTEIGCKSECRFYWGRLKEEKPIILSSLTPEEVKKTDCLWYNVDSRTTEVKK